MLTARRSNQSILKKISPGCSLEGIMLKLKLQYFGHLMRRVDSLEKTLMLGGIGGRRRGRQRMRWLNGITRWTWVWVNSGSWWWTGRPGVLQFMGSQRVGHDWATELNWTELSFSKEEEKFIYLIDKQEVTTLSLAPQLNSHGYRAAEHHLPQCSHIKRMAFRSPRKTFLGMYNWQEAH